MLCLRIGMLHVCACTIVRCAALQNPLPRAVIYMAHISGLQAGMLMLEVPAVQDGELKAVPFF